MFLPPKNVYYVWVSLCGLFVYFLVFCFHLYSYFKTNYTLAYWIWSQWTVVVSDKRVPWVYEKSAVNFLDHYLQTLAANICGKDTMTTASEVSIILQNIFLKSVFKHGSLLFCFLLICARCWQRGNNHDVSCK